MSELQARDLRSWCPLMHASWSGSADVFRAVVVSIEDNLGRDQVRCARITVYTILYCGVILYYSYAREFRCLAALSRFSFRACVGGYVYTRKCQAKNAGVESRVRSVS